MEPADKALLARLVYRYTLSEVIRTLIEICQDRAGWLESKYHDASAAGLWEHAARLLKQAGGRIRI